MSESTATETVYSVLDRGAQELQNIYGMLYLEALSLMGENLRTGSVEQHLTAEATKKLNGWLTETNELSGVTAEEYRKAMQLAVLKGMREATQPNHAMTPDAVGLFIGFLTEKILSYDAAQSPQITDLACGSGNLLTAVMNQVSKPAIGTGVEADETLANLAYVNARLQGKQAEIVHDDSVKMQIDSEADIAVADLPLGYYPDAEAASGYELKAEDGLSFVHHLLIEKSIRSLKAGGFAIFLVPNQIFQADETGSLHSFVKNSSMIYAFLQLPDTMFKSKDLAKSILVVRKHQPGIQPPQQALLAELPSFSKEASLQDMTLRISAWFDEHLSS
ncbi:class I SAM-dependent methyltransferase [Salisediminibacterium halotolerans]|uniref:Site-specific DNA-methyltransferase (Adenine-specific) n=1 Tax=Salisediminibacterium halotolerans TaxID=517425 RepID=A0A1H9V6L4_9BACI|nr:class I SAM-dependent methyltransferase [Salisediminibacterium haloalkalitolerans]SES17209.1 site-specific DNA-methyltransferase (adenine-specific) [Salisediminibacterium haloalkalitolerans]